MPLAGRFVVQSVSALLVIGLLALAGIVATTVWLNEQSRSYFEQTVEARGIRSIAIELRSSVQSAESSERGYLLTGNQIYLSPYDTAKTQAMRRLELLQQKSHTSIASGVMPRLGAAVAEKLADLDRMIALKAAGKDAEALAIVRTNRGKLLMDEINLFTSGIVRAADEQLTAGVTRQRTNASWLRLVSIAAALLVAIVVAGVLVTVYRYTREILLARDELNRLNAGLEERVAARTAALARANAEIQRFAHIVSHDLRAPLVNIVGFSAEIEASLKDLQAAAGGENGDLAKQVAEAEIPEALGFIRSSTRKMDRLIGAILKISREGQRKLQPETVSIGAVIAQARDAIAHQLVEADGECSVDLEVDRIVADRLSLEQIVGNLLDNAVKYRAPGRNLRIGIRSRRVGAEAVRIEVTDNGRGIASEDHGRIFELFRRAGAQDQAGEGIGLAYAQTLVRNLGGEISVASQPGHGTTFSIVLPTDVSVGARRLDEQHAS